MHPSWNICPTFVRPLSGHSPVGFCTALAAEWHLTQDPDGLAGLGGCGRGRSPGTRPRTPRWRGRISTRPERAAGEPARRVVRRDRGQTPSSVLSRSFRHASLRLQRKDSQSARPTRSPYPRRNSRSDGPSNYVCRLYDNAHRRLPTERIALP
jgi:hypothetical protein